MKKFLKGKKSEKNPTPYVMALRHQSTVAERGKDGEFNEGRSLVLPGGAGHIEEAELEAVNQE